MSRKTARNLFHVADPVRKATCEQNREARIDRAFASYVPNKNGHLPFTNRHTERAARKAAQMEVR